MHTVPTPDFRTPDFRRAFKILAGKEWTPANEVESFTKQPHLLEMCRNGVRREVFEVLDDHESLVVERAGPEFLAEYVHLLMTTMTYGMEPSELLPHTKAWCERNERRAKGTRHRDDALEFKNYTRGVWQMIECFNKWKNGEARSEEQVAYRLNSLVLNCRAALFEMRDEEGYSEGCHAQANKIQAVMWFLVALGYPGYCD
jgi:hypothetical protein